MSLSDSLLVLDQSLPWALVEMLVSVMVALESQNILITTIGFMVPRVGFLCASACRVRVR